MTKHEGFFSTNVSFKMDATEAQQKADACLTKAEFDAIEWFGQKITNCATTGRFETGHFAVIGLSPKITDYFIDLGYKVDVTVVERIEVDGDDTEDVYIVGNVVRHNPSRSYVNISWKREGAI